MRRLSSQVWVGFGVLSLCSAVLLWHVRRYFPFLADDALISLRYAQRFLDGQGLTWDSYQPVEGYSNFLWTLLAAGLGALGMNLVDALRLLGGASAVVMIGALVWFGVGWRRDRTPWPSLGAGMLCALSGTAAVWVVGGLEQPLIAASLAVATVTLGAWSERDEGSPSLGLLHLCQASLVVMVLTRPDSPLFVVALCLAYVVARKGWRRAHLVEAFVVGAPSALAYAGLLGFRLIYYGEWVPNTAYVKIALTWERVMQGWTYFSDGAWTYWALGLALVMFVSTQVRLPWRRLCLVVLPMALWSMYVVFVGGDIFPGRRHFAPLVPLLALLLSEVMAAFERAHADEARGLHQVMLVRLCFVLGCFWHVQSNDPAHAYAKQERWEWTCRTISNDLVAAFGSKDPLFAVTAAGCYPYWTRFRSLDLLGLNDYHIARNPPKGFGKGALAHDLGDGEYSWARKPDLLHTGIPGQGMMPHHFGVGAQQMQRKKAFKQHFQPLFIEGIGYKEQMHLRFTSEHVGFVTKAPGHTVIPAHLFANKPNRRAFVWQNRDHFVVPMKHKHELKSPPLRLEPGKYEVSLELEKGELPGVHLNLKFEKGKHVQMLPTLKPWSATFVITKPTTVHVVATAKTKASRLLKQVSVKKTSPIYPMPGMP